MKRPIYLDNLSTTPVDKRVVDVMLPFMTEFFGNAGSGHIYGRQVDSAVRTARDQVAKLIGAECGAEIYFTSGATESNNTAIKGIAHGLAKRGKHIITAKSEHKAVLEACRSMEAYGFETTYLNVDVHGMVNPNDVRQAIRKGAPGTTDCTILVSIMGANNEIGTINPIAEIGKVCEVADIIFHVDAAQYAGKVPMNVHAMGIDLLSISGHKIYGPKGIGALFVAKCNSKINLSPLMDGGGQESGLRPGTQPVQLIVALGKACEIARFELDEQMKHLTMLRDRLYNQLKNNLDGVTLNGHPTNRLPGNLNVIFDNIDGELLMLKLKDIAVSTGSACSKSIGSHVLQAIGVEPKQARGAIRFGIGKQNTMEEMDYAALKVIEHVNTLRSCCCSPKAVIPKLVS